MRGLVLAGVLSAALLSPVAAHADDTFDSTGWTLLGEQTVDGKRDTDTIEVGRGEGRFTKLTIVVLDDDLVLEDMTVTYGNGKTDTPDVKQYFKKGSRTRAIDLAGGARGIKSISLTYGDLDDDKGKRWDRKKRGRRHHVRQGKTPRVQVWGLEEAAPPPEELAFDSNAWTLVAEKRVSKKKGTITLKVKGKKVAYDQLAVVVADGDVRITDVDVQYRKGKRGRHRVDSDFRTRDHRSFGLGGDRRAIKSVKISYVNRGRRATIQVFGQLEEAPEAPDWDSSGWTMLSEQTVDGKHDTDVVQVGRNDGKFSSLMFVVLDGDIDMDGITINLTRGKSLEPELRQSFKNGSRTRQIDLPGKRAVIKDIELRYGTKRGNGKARVQIWAR